MSDSQNRPYVPFPTTQWTWVRQAGEIDPTLRRAALEVLLRRYTPAIESHLIVVKRMNVHEAADTVQEFLISKVLEQEILAQAQPGRGKLRYLLLRALQRFLVSEYRIRSAQKRSAPNTQELDQLTGNLEPKDQNPNPAQSFDIAWARQVLHEALARMQKECSHEKRPELWGVFECRVVKPTLQHEATEDYPTLVARYQLESPAQAANLLVTAKRMFIRHMRGVVGEYVTTEQEIDEEILELEKTLAQPSTGETPPEPES